MNPISKSLCFAAALIALAAANRFGLVADGIASTLFAVIPAVFAATLAARGCRTRQVAG